MLLRIALIGSYYGPTWRPRRLKAASPPSPTSPTCPCTPPGTLGVQRCHRHLVRAGGGHQSARDRLPGGHGPWPGVVRAGAQDKPYTYGRHYFPHDIAARDWSQDGRTRLQIAESLGLKPAVVVPQTQSRTRFRRCARCCPACHFDASACHQGLEALKAYRREWDETRRTWRDTPLHDWSSHGSSALASFCVGLRRAPEAGDADDSGAGGEWQRLEEQFQWMTAI